MSQFNAAETLQRYAPPTVRQFSVFLDNKPGKLLEMLRHFEDSITVHLCAFSVQESSDHAVIRLIPNNADGARQLLRERSLAFTEVELLVVELAEDHSLASMCMDLLGAELNIRFAYPLMLRPNGTPTIALSVDDYVLAGQILRRKEFRLVGEAELP